MSTTADLDLELYPYLAALNEAQLRAVTAPPTTPLQILAGPGSGKTRVLTSRVAHLVRCHGYKPYHITAVTFTNKAAAEMRKRLVALLGERDANQLVLGTFHATCAKYLRRYGSRIGLKNNFAITDADDCKKIMSRLIKDRKEELAKEHLQLKENAVLSEISKAKAKGETPDGMALRAAKAEAAANSDPFAPSSANVLAVVAELYAEYETALRDAGALDFDDLLLYGLKLFTEHPDIIENCRHILVDEFQDTNTTQYALMKCFANANGGVSIVGDPDQSIYGWRSAEIENLEHMIRDFRNVDAIHLEENYRSTGSILSASHSIVSQDTNRIKKGLFTSHPKSTPVTLKLFATPVIEASYIATEIKRMVAYSGEMLNYDDFAILLRYNALSRVIESALQKEGIPNRVIGGHKFFERMEIKDLLAYLQLADNPNFTPAFMRVLNVPKRQIGDQTLLNITTAAKKLGIPPMELCKKVADKSEHVPTISSAAEGQIGKFVKIVRKIRQAALDGMSVADLIRFIINETKYEEWLKRKNDDFEQRWENVQELISYSVIVAEEQARQEGVDSEVFEETGETGFSSARTVMAQLTTDKVTKEEPRLHPIFRKRGSNASSSRSNSVTLSRKKQRVKVDNDVIEVLSSEDEIEAFDAEPVSVRLSTSPAPDGPGLTPLRFFLQSSMLSTDTESNDDGAQVPRVIISTVHAAKGLEWPVVFIPAVEHGTFPAARSIEEKEIAEERRLLYVAMTRAQVFLTMTYSMNRMVGGEDQERNLSEFVDKSLRKDPNLFTSEMPTIDETVRQQMAPMLGRPPVDEGATQQLIMKHIRAAPPQSTWDAPERGSNRFARRDGPGLMSRAFEYWASDVDEYNLPPRGSSSRQDSRPGFVAFSSAKSFMPPDIAPAKPKPPVVRLQSSNRNLPGALPFTFNEAPRPSTSLTSFTSSNTSSLAAMKMLGLPEAGPVAPKTAANRGGGAIQNARSNPASGPSVATLNNGAPSSGPTRVGVAGGASRGGDQTDGIIPGAGGAGSATIPLARGTKRLGMGRAVAPWGSKRGKTE